MNRLILTCAFALVPIVSFAAVRSSDMSGAQETNAAPEKFKLPSGARLISVSHASELRAFPEMVKTTKTSETENVGVIGVSATDRLYKSPQSYKSTVEFFDKQFQDLADSKVDRVKSETATGWRVRLGDGTAANVLVRNTNPATIETMEAVGAAGEIRIKEKLRPDEQKMENKGEMPQPLNK